MAIFSDLEPFGASMGNATISCGIESDSETTARSGVLATKVDLVLPGGVAALAPQSLLESTRADVAAARSGHACAGRHLGRDPKTKDLPAARALWPRSVFAPFVDVGLSAASGPYPQFDMLGAAQAFGVKYFNLGFVTSDLSGQPIFAGYRLDSPWDHGLRQQIKGLRHMGGDVAICFGGANGAEMELARVIDDVNELTAAYERVVEAYGVSRVNFAIEESALVDQESIDRRSQAIARLQQERASDGRPLEVWLSVPAMPAGLTSDALCVVISAHGAGIDLGGVNLMAMNFGEAAARDPEGRMGDLAIQAAHVVFDQLCDIQNSPNSGPRAERVWAQVGITTMVGQNDTLSERFYQRDAQRLLVFAEEKRLGMLSIWSINRDASTGIANYDSTGIAQEPYEFTTIFAPYAIYAGVHAGCSAQG
jgi:hypothetical protein